MAKEKYSPPGMRSKPPLREVVEMVARGEDPSLFVPIWSKYISDLVTSGVTMDSKPLILYIGISSLQSILETMFKESIDENNDVDEYWLERLQEINRISEAMSDALNYLAGVSSRPDDGCVEDKQPKVYAAERLRLNEMLCSLKILQHTALAITGARALDSRQQAWLHGLPGFENPKGVPVQVVNFSPPAPGVNQLRVTLFASRNIDRTLQKISADGVKIPHLSLVVRTDPKKELDDQYRFTNAQIVSVEPSVESKGAEDLIVSFKRTVATKGLMQNPGPPPDAPEIRDQGSNTGWFFDVSDDPERGTPLRIIDFVPPHFNGRLVICSDEVPPEIHHETQLKSHWNQLIFVLPDRANQQYIEYKLWDVKSVNATDEQHLVFEADWIECLIG